MSEGEPGPPRLTRAQQELVKGALSLVQRLAVYHAKCHRLSRAQKKELIAVGAVALTEAAIRYDPSWETDFDHFAWKRIAGAMKDWLKRETQYHAVASRMMMERLDRPRDPDSPWRDSDEEVLARVELDFADAASYLFAGLIGPLAGAAGEEGMILRETYANAIQALKEGLLSLEPGEAELIDRRYCQGQSWPAVARQAGASESTVKRKEAQALVKLRGFLIARGVQHAPATEDRQCCA